jgi:hypothetical protein
LFLKPLGCQFIGGVEREVSDDLIAPITKAAQPCKIAHEVAVGAMFRQCSKNPCLARLLNARRCKQDRRACLMRELHGLPIFADVGEVDVETFFTATEHILELRKRAAENVHLRRIDQVFGCLLGEFSSHRCQCGAIYVPLRNLC